MNVFYAKSILYAFGCIDSLIEQIDEMVYKRAIASMNDYSPCFSQCEKILELTRRKKSLLKLKEAVKRAARCFTSEEKDCMDYKYFKFKPKKYYENFDASSRAYFRRQNKIVIKFADKMEATGLSDKVFRKEFLVMDFFKELLKRVIEQHNASFKNKKEKSVKKKVNIRANDFYSYSFSS